MVRLISMILLFAACTSGTDKDRDQEDADSGPVIQRPRQVSGRDGEAVSEQEGDLAQRPAEIAGAFLTCAVSSQKGGEGDTYGCRLERDGDRVVLMNPMLARWSIVSDNPQGEGALDERSTEALRPQEAGTLWHVIFSIPKATADERKLRVEIDMADQAQPVRFESSLKDATQRKFYTFSEGPVRLGSPGLVKSILKSCPLGILTTPLVGSDRDYPFRIDAAKADIAVSITGLCGVDTNGNTVDLVNSEGATVASETLPVGESSMMMPIPGLVPGVYTVKIRAGKDFLGLDDFILRGVGIVVQGARARVSSTD